MDQDLLLAKTNAIQNCLQRIRSKVGDDPNRLYDLDIQDIVVLNLQRAVQLVIDLASYVVAFRKLGVPATLKENFQILERNSLISHELSLKMMKMVGFRNIAVHDYQTVAVEILQAIVMKHLGDIEEFYTRVLELKN